MSCVRRRKGRGEGEQRVAPPLSAHEQRPLKWLVALERVDAACRGGDGVEGEGGMCACWGIPC